jgi:ribosomal protein S1
MGSSALKEDTVLFGYVKNYTEKGCFVSVSNDFDVRIEISELSD